MMGILASCLLSPATNRPPRVATTALAGAALAAAMLIGANPALAQTIDKGILAPGEAAVTAFSGAIEPATIAPGVDPAIETFIDVNGASARIVDLRRMPGPPEGQLADASKPFTFTAAQLGQVFAVALDNATPPNIYLAASSAYGLPIVSPDQSGNLTHVKSGGPGAIFMPGLWGPESQNGGPGSVWKIDGVTGAVSLFANVTFGGKANDGPALGGLVYDPEHDHLLAADRESGMIHVFAMDGSERGRFDHGIDGRASSGLPAVPFDSAHRLDIASPQFDSTKPSTWSYAPPARRVFGLGIRARRLYYAIAEGAQIWSVGINDDGSFAGDARRDITVPPGAPGSEISKIAFDDQGRMLLAERPAPTGNFNFEVLARPAVGRVLRYAIVDQNPDGTPLWQQVPDEYAVGFPADLRNGNGGVAVGYDYDHWGEIDRGSCGGFVWSTGERLRSTLDPALKVILDRSGPEFVDGLQGNFLWLVRPANLPPRISYFVDYDDRFTDKAARGHLGDIAIWRVCGPVLPGGWMLPFPLFGWLDFGPPMPPPLSCPPADKKPGLMCCPKGSSPDASGQCKPWCPNGAKDQQSLHLCALGFDPASYNPKNPGSLSCLGGGKPHAGKGVMGCAAASPIFGAHECMAGWTKQQLAGVGAICQPTKQQMQCGPGEQVSPIDHHCHQLCGGGAWPAPQCCPAGSVMSVSGKCCPPGSTPDGKTGACKPPHTPTPNQPPSGGQTTPPGIGGQTTPPGGGRQTTPPGGGRQTTPGQGQGGNVVQPTIAGQCQPGYVAGQNGTCCLASGLMSSGSCCPTGQIAAGPNKTQCRSIFHWFPPTGAKPTGGGQGGVCCQAGMVPTASGACCRASQISTTGKCCPIGQRGDPRGNCAPVSACPSGQSSVNGACCPANQIYQDPDIGRAACCPQVLTAAGQCIILREHATCKAGFTSMADGSCCPSPLVSRDGKTCNRPVEPTIPSCSGGNVLLPDGTCCPQRQISPDGRVCRLPNDPTIEPEIVVPPGPDHRRPFENRPQRPETQGPEVQRPQIQRPQTPEIRVPQRPFRWRPRIGTPNRPSPPLRHCTGRRC